MSDERQPQEHPKTPWQRLTELRRHLEEVLEPNGVHHDNLAEWLQGLAHKAGAELTRDPKAIGERLGRLHPELGAAAEEFGEMLRRLTGGSDENQTSPTPPDPDKTVDGTIVKDDAQE